MEPSDLCQEMSSLRENKYLESRLFHIEANQVRYISLVFYNEDALRGYGSLNGTPILRKYRIAGRPDNLPAMR
jgi:hypothetical protein